jgi:hypothetical protein
MGLLHEAQGQVRSCHLLQALKNTNKKSARKKSEVF